ncbi:O-antigen ligase family protein [Streptomyces sp. R08]|uniref:O-antigen ligase family protein n=1 Tax=Streptomyces sp. R08 TaxID=3238624 RepID=A0AB39MPW4_9ACTN
MASATGPDADSERRNVSDAAGIVVLGLCAAWSLITAALHDGRPEGVLLAVLAVAAGYASGRISGALVPVAAPCAGALAGLGLALAEPHLAPGPQFVVPLGHAGATAALLTVAAGSACCAAWAATAPALRLALGLLAAGITVTAAVLDSSTGFVLCTAVLLCSLAAGRLRHRGPGIAGLGLATVLVTGMSWALAGNVLPDGLTASLAGQLTPHRIQLWQDALHMAHQDSSTGVGPGRFGELSSAAAEALLPDGKPHSAPLQLAAEQGIIGVLLLAAAYGWILHALWRTTRSTPIALTAAAALTGLALVASVGNALSFTSVSVGAGFLAGLATSHPIAEDASRSRPDAHARGDRLAP